MLSIETSYLMNNTETAGQGFTSLNKTCASGRAIIKRSSARDSSPKMIKTFSTDNFNSEN